MDLDDRVVLVTPEGLSIELVLAGLGSRFVATLLDWLLKMALLVAASIFASAGDGNGWLIAVAALVGFFILVGYDILFETAAGGQTPGKRWTGLRVVDKDGAPVRFVPSAVRNFLRLVDFLPAGYLVGTLMVVCHPRHQRVGDLVAGTYVVRERRGNFVRHAAAPAWSAPAGSPWSSLAAAAPVGWDVASVTPDEVAAVRRFLERRPSLTLEARHRLGLELANRLWPKVAIPPEPLSPEQFLEKLVAAKAAAGI